MTNDQRIETIETFIHEQPYIRGVQFRVVPDPEKEDHFIIELGHLSHRQLSTLQHRLRLAQLFHIRTHALKGTLDDKSQTHGSYQNHNPKHRRRH